MVQNLILNFFQFTIKVQILDVNLTRASFPLKNPNPFYLSNMKLNDSNENIDSAKRAIDKLKNATQARALTAIARLLMDQEFYKRSKGILNLLALQSKDKKVNLTHWIAFCGSLGLCESDYIDATFAYVASKDIAFDEEFNITFKTKIDIPLERIGDGRELGDEIMKTVEENVESKLATDQLCKAYYNELPSFSKEVFSI